MSKKSTKSGKLASTVRRTEYKGNSLLQFGEEGSRFPFQFGAGKAGCLCDALEELGPEKFARILYNLADREMPEDLMERTSDVKVGKVEQKDKSDDE